MRFIVIADIHGAFENLEKILKYAQKTKRAVLFAGDIIGYPDEKDLPKEKKEQFEWFKQFAKEQMKKFIAVCKKYSDVQIFSVLGNYDLKQLAKDKNLTNNVYNVEAKPQILQNLKICGMGGATAVISFLTRIGYWRLITSKDFISRKKCNIFISHEPPQGYGDISYFLPLGSYGITVFPEEKIIENIKKLEPEDPLINTLIEMGDLTEEDLKENKNRTKEEQKEIDFLKNTKRKDVLMKHVGNLELKKFVENNKKIKLFVAGHIHSGQSALEVKTGREIKPDQTIFTTLILNPGPLMKGHFAEVDVTKRKVKFEGFGNIGNLEI